MSFGSFPFAGEKQSLHAWAPPLSQINFFLSQLIENCAPRAWDIPLPLACFGAMTTTGGVVTKAQYFTLEPLVKAAFITIVIEGITRVGPASSAMYVPLPPIPQANYTTTTLIGDGLNAGGVEVVMARPIAGVGGDILAVQRYSGANWSTDAGNYFRLNGLVYYG